MKSLLLTIFVSLLLIDITAFSQTGKQISLDDIYKNYIFYPNSIDQLRSMNDGLHYTTLEQGGMIVKWNYETGEKAGLIFVAGKDLKGLIDYDFSADENKILLTTAKESIYRRSFKAEYFIYDIPTKNLKPLSAKGKQQLASFSPDGKKVAFVRDNNMFITDIESMTETQITFDGVYNKIINGATDWVYEEEFGFSKGYIWSPDSRRIAFYRFDESGVKEFSMSIYKNLYPEEYKFKYPKTGEDNSLVTIHCYNLESRQTVKMDTGPETDQYIGRIFWTKDPMVVSMLRINRLQNKQEILHANTDNGQSAVVFTETNEKFINEPNDNSFVYLPDGENFILLSERSGWSHFYLHNFKTNQTKAITSGEFDVIGFKGYDEKAKVLYFLSHERGAIYQDVYSIKIDGSSKKRITMVDGWNDAEFSNGFKFYITDHSTLDSPSVFSLFNAKGKEIRVLEDNSGLIKIMKDYNFVKHEFITVPGADGTPLNAWVMKPSDFDPAKKYPLFMYVYGGPQSQNVNQAFTYSDMWHQMLVQKGYIVVCVDGRGTDGRGEAFRKSTYMQMGKYETEDQIAAAQWFGNQTYIDKSRIGMFGWSYGGFMSLSCLFKGADIFKMAISVAPVTNWRYYDSIYTERYMRKPQDNASGYDDNSPINHVQKMKGKLLLVHGMADDNVHFQNSVELVQKLILYNKQFDMQFYPNRNHGIYGGNSTMHLYTKMTEFIGENL